MYLDPAFGGMLIQAIIAIIAVGGGILFALRRKIRTLSKKDASPTVKNRNVNNITESDVIDSLEEDSK